VRQTGLLALAMLVVPASPGCFYVAPGWEPAANQTPVVISPDPADGLQDIPLLMDRDTRITVVGRDPEGQPLDFLWIVPVDVEFTPTTGSQGDTWYSVLDITADPLLDGQLIEVIVSDGELDEFVSWLVEVP